MALFQHVEGETVVTVTNGLYRQADLYVRDDALYARHGGGFIRLYADGSTSRDTIRVETLACSMPLFRDAFGRLFIAPAGGRAQLTPSSMKVLA